MKNKLERKEVLGIPSKAVFRSLSRTVKHLNKELLLLEERLIVSVKEDKQEQLRLLKTIPGIEKSQLLYWLYLQIALPSLKTRNNCVVMQVLHQPLGTRAVVFGGSVG